MAAKRTLLARLYTLLPWLLLVTVCASIYLFLTADIDPRIDNPAGEFQQIKDVVVGEEKTMSWTWFTSSLLIGHHPSDQLQSDEEIDHSCQIIHLALACMDHSCRREAVVLLKSLLFYRHDPIHLHILTDNFSKTVFLELFRTWLLPGVRVSYYLFEDIVKYLRRGGKPLPSTDGLREYLPLFLPQILPKGISKVIFLDTNIILASNIISLWNIAIGPEFEATTALGLVESQNDRYMCKEEGVRCIHPARGRGFSLGVMIMNLPQLEVYGWKRRWYWTILDHQLWEPVSKQYTSQDILNAILNTSTIPVKTLPCGWNVQISRSEDSPNTACPVHKSNRMAILLTPDQRGRSSTKSVYTDEYETFVEYNGNLLRHQQMSDCGRQYGHKSPETDAELQSPSSFCDSYQNSWRTTFRVHLYYAEYEPPPCPPHVGNVGSDCALEPEGVTLMSQLTMDRIIILDTLSKHWPGPISLALYISDGEMSQLDEYLEQSMAFRDRKDIGLHLMFKSGEHYPVNHLRNIALNNVRTKYVFLSDIDFLPPFHLHGYICDSVKLHNMDKDSEKKALVIPAFESQQYLHSFPYSKADLISLYNTRLVYSFKYHFWKRGHNATNYPKWMTTSEPYRIYWETKFEPYVVVKTRTVPRYSPQFVGYGANKYTQIMELDASGYEFIVLPFGFIIHMPHTQSPDDSNFRNSPEYQKCSKMIQSAFIDYLYHRYQPHTQKYYAVLL